MLYIDFAHNCLFDRNIYPNVYFIMLLENGTRVDSKASWHLQAY